MSKNRQETIADIVAWLRRPRDGENAYLTLWRSEIADLIEATWKRERDRIYHRHYYVLKRQKIVAKQAADLAKRMEARHDAHDRTSDDVAREFKTMTLFGEAQTVRYRGTGFYAGRRV